MSRRLIVALALVLATLGSGLVIAATASKPDFSIVVVPDSQSIRAGQTATYGIGIDRRAGFTRGVALQVSGLPPTVTASILKGVVDGLEPTGMTPAIRAARASCLAAAKRRKSVRRRRAARAACRTVARRRAAKLRIVALRPAMPAERRLTRTAALVVSTNQGGVTPPGTYTFSVTATSAGSRTAVTRKATLVVLPPVTGAPNFAITVAPATQTVVQSDGAAYSVSGLRSGGFSGPISLSAENLPAGVTASFAPPALEGTASSVLTLSTAPTARTGTYTVWLLASATVAGNPLKRLSPVTLVVERNREFSIAGDAPDVLSPGAATPIDLTLTNPHSFAIAIRGLTVAVAPETDRAGCSATDNFDVAQVPGAAYPIVLPAGATRRLSEAAVAPADWPRLSMRDLPSNQDACKDARIHLRYSGSATKP